MKDPICGMNVKETTPLRLAVKGEVFYFCSKHCLDKFARQNGLSAGTAGSLSSVPWFKNKVLIVASVLSAACLLSYALPFLVPFRETLMEYLRRTWWAMLLGLALGGVLDHYVPREYISFFLAKKRKRTVLFSVFLGFFMSICSHGILALSIELHKKGASTPAVIAFLLASPWANLPLTLMFIGFFGALKAGYIILSAIIIAITTGLIFQILDAHDLIEKNRNTVELKDDFVLAHDVKCRMGQYRWTSAQLKEDFRGVSKGIAALADMVLWWTLIGMGLASIAGAYIPPHIFHQYMGPTFLGLIITLAVATVMEVCSEAMSPFAFEIYRQTGEIGNSFVFLMAGVVTDYTEIGLLWHNVGRRVAIWLPVITVPQVILFGILANIIF